MWEKIPYHDWNDWINLWKIEIKPIILKNIQNDLKLMKSALKNNILVKLNWIIPEIQRIVLDNKILLKNEKWEIQLENEKWEIQLSLEKLKSEDFYKLITYKKEIYDIFKKQIKYSILFPQDEKDNILEEINTVCILIEEIEKKIKNIEKLKKK